MQTNRRYKLRHTLQWQWRSILLFMVADSAVVAVYQHTEWAWMLVPWEPISLLGIAVSFYLGFKNNSSYDRLWEARKIWGGIVNSSRTFTVMARDYVSDQFADAPSADGEIAALHKTLVHRHVAWLKALVVQLRKLERWEHTAPKNHAARKTLDTHHHEKRFDALRPYLSDADFAYLETKGNRASHLLSLQSKQLAELRKKGLLDDFRHMQIMTVIEEFYTLQGKAERIKKFPFPRQYATVNFFFVVLFLIVLPFALMEVFHDLHPELSIWTAVPVSVVLSWVFLTMEMIGDYSENPFEGLTNDVPIRSMARGIEIDIRQMLDETDLPAPDGPADGSAIFV